MERGGATNSASTCRRSFPRPGSPPALIGTTTSAWIKEVGKINVTFTFTGSYPILKRFLQTLEQFPKFLLLEKVDFLKIRGDGTMLELRIILAAYYANY